MVKILGAKLHSTRLSASRNKIQDAVGEAVFQSAQAVRDIAVESIADGGIPGPAHIPSAPGEPPNRDTGYLDSHIDAAKTAPLKSEVSSNAEYSAELEFGTSRIEERPYMRPAAMKGRKIMLTAVAEATHKVLKESQK